MRAASCITYFSYRCRRGFIFYIGNIDSTSAVNGRTEQRVVSYKAVMKIIRRIFAEELRSIGNCKTEDEHTALGLRPPIRAAVEVHVSVKDFNRMRLQCILHAVCVTERGNERCGRRKMRKIDNLNSASSFTDNIRTILVCPHLTPDGRGAADVRDLCD